MTQHKTKLEIQFGTYIYLLDIYQMGWDLSPITMTITMKRKQELRAFSHATLFQDNVRLFNFYLGQIMFLGTAATAK